MINNLKTALILSRPVNLLIAFISVWAAALIAGEALISVRIIAACVSAAFITAYGNIVNDIFDIEIDRINKSRRPLPSGLMSVKEARLTAILCAVVGLLLSFVVADPAFIIALSALILLTIYTPVFKGLLFIGNISVALVSSLAFIYGAMAVDRPYGAAILSVFAFLYHFGREMVKDVEDLAADSKSGIRTGASIDNSETARFLAGGLFLLLVVATLIPFFTDHFGAGYFLTVLFGVDIVLVVSAIKLFQTDDPRVMRKIAALLKAAMPLGILAVLLGSRGF